MLIIVDNVTFEKIIQESKYVNVSNPKLLITNSNTF